MCETDLVYYFIRKSFYAVIAAEINMSAYDYWSYLFISITQKFKLDTS